MAEREPLVWLAMGLVAALALLVIGASLFLFLPVWLSWGATLLLLFLLWAGAREWRQSRDSAAE